MEFFKKRGVALAVLVIANARRLGCVTAARRSLGKPGYEDLRQTLLTKLGR